MASRVPSWVPVVSVVAVALSASGCGADHAPPDASLGGDNEWTTDAKTDDGTAGPDAQQGQATSTDATKTAQNAVTTPVAGGEKEAKQTADKDAAAHAAPRDEAKPTETLSRPTTTGTTATAPTATPPAEPAYDLGTIGDQMGSGEAVTEYEEYDAPAPPAKTKADRREAGGGRGAPMGYAQPTSGAVATGTASTADAPAYYPPPPPTVYAPPPTQPVVPESTNTEHYTDYGVNGFVLADQDALSTFSIDVDTASYSMARRKLREGYLPEQAGVRVEEFVNYFPYEYKQPKPGDPFAVDFEAAPSPWNAQHEIVRVGVQGKKVAADQRPPVHLTFLVDTSGSMQSDDKIGLVKRTLKMLTEQLEDGDTVAIATYAGSTEIVLQPTPMSHKQDILRSLDRLTAGGSTAMGAGIDLAYQLADSSYSSGGVNRVIICSDGDANVGETNPDALAKKIHKYAEKGITLTTTGFGDGNYQDTMMERLADQGDGNYYYVDSENEARRIFVDKLTSTIDVIAKDVKIQVDWNPQTVYAYRLIGYENRDIADQDFRNDKVDAGEVGAGHEVTALYEVVLKDEHVTGDLGTVRIRNKAPGPDAPAVERSYTLASSTMKTNFQEASDQFRLAFAAAEFAEILRGSPHVSEVSLKQVQAIARGAARAEYPEDAELVDLIGRAAQLKGETSYSSR